MPGAPGFRVDVSGHRGAPSQVVVALGERAGEAVIGREDLDAQEDRPGGIGLLYILAELYANIGDQVLFLVNPDGEF